MHAATLFEAGHCTQCPNTLEAYDGHTLCPSCLGPDHLQEALINPCMNCAIMSVAQRRDRLAGLDTMRDPPLLAPLAKRRNTGDVAVEPQKKRPSPGLAQQVQSLSSDMEQIKSMLLALSGGPFTPNPSQGTPSEMEDECDVLSTAASNVAFQPNCVSPSNSVPCKQPAPLASLRSATHSRDSGDDSSASESTAAEPITLQCTMKAALARLALDTPPAQSAEPSVFFKRAGGNDSFAVPVCKDFVAEFSAAFGAPPQRTRTTPAMRTLAAMADAENHSLGNMPAVDTCIAALVVSPDEALRPDPRCPSAECRRTDELFIKAHNTATRVGRLSNSLAHLLLALQSSLPGANTDRAPDELLNAALQTMGYIAQDMGRLVATLVRGRRQVWLAQTPLSETCRATIRALPLIPGHVFGPAVKDALDRRALISESRRQETAQRPFRFRTPVPPNPRPGLPRFSQTREARHQPRPSSSFSPRERQGRPPIGARNRPARNPTQRPAFDTRPRKAQH